MGSVREVRWRGRAEAAGRDDDVEEAKSKNRLQALRTTPDVEVWLGYRSAPRGEGQGDGCEFSFSFFFLRFFPRRSNRPKEGRSGRDSVALHRDVRRRRRKRERGLRLRNPRSDFGFKVFLDQLDRLRVLTSLVRNTEASPGVEKLCTRIFGSARVKERTRREGKRTFFWKLAPSGDVAPQICVQAP